MNVHWRTCRKLSWSACSCEVYETTFWRPRTKSLMCYKCTADQFILYFKIYACQSVNQSFRPNCQLCYTRRAQKCGKTTVYPPLCGASRANDVWPVYLAHWFTLTLSKSSSMRWPRSQIKVQGHREETHRRKTTFSAMQARYETRQRHDRSKSRPGLEPVNK